MSFTPQNQIRSKLKKSFLVIIGVYIMVLASIYAFQESIIFLPTTLPQDYVFNFDHEFEELFFNTEDGARLNALHFRTQDSKGVILYFHGNAGDLQRWGKITTYFVDLGYDVVIMDYRTYGKSKGKLSETVLYSDAQVFYNYVKDLYDERDIIVYGRSLGTGIASYITSINQPQQLILETPYYSLTDVGKHRFPVFPVKRLMKYKFPSHEYLQEANCNIAIIHGTNDYVVPYKSGKKLFDSLVNKNAKLFTIEDGSHNDLINFEGYKSAINTLLE